MLRNVASYNELSDISKKEITISLAQYTDLIAKESVLEQIRYVVTKEKDAFGTVGILKAILQIDTPKKE